MIVWLFEWYRILEPPRFQRIPGCLAFCPDAFRINVGAQRITTSLARNSEVQLEELPVGFLEHGGSEKTYWCVLRREWMGVGEWDDYY